MATFNFDTPDPDAMRASIGAQQDQQDINWARLTTEQRDSIRHARAGRALGQILGTNPQREDPRVAKAKQMQDAMKSVAHLATDPAAYLRALGEKYAQMGMPEEAAQVNDRLLKHEEQMARTKGAKSEEKQKRIPAEFWKRFTPESIDTWAETGRAQDLVQLPPDKQGKGREITKSYGGKDRLGWEDADGRFHAYSGQGEGVKVEVNTGDRKGLKTISEIRAQFNRDSDDLRTELRGYDDLAGALRQALTNPAAATASGNLLVRAFRTDSNIGVAERAQLLRSGGLPQRVVDGLTSFLEGTMTPQRLQQIVQLVQPMRNRARENLSGMVKSYQEQARSDDLSEANARFITGSADPFVQAAVAAAGGAPAGAPMAPSQAAPQGARAAPGGAASPAPAGSVRSAIQAELARRRQQQGGAR